MLEGVRWRAVYLQMGVFLLLYSTLTARRVKRAVLTPANPWAVFGEGLEVSCSVRDNNHTAATLSFHLRRCGNPLPAQLQRTVSRPNATTLVISFHNVTREMILQCCDVAGRGLDAVLIHVGYKPRPFRIVSVAAFNWQTLNFSWTDSTPPARDYITSFRITTTAYWKAGDAADFRLCQHYLATSCSLSLHDQQADGATYFVFKVTSTNPLGSFSTPAQVALMDKINKPSAVEGLTVQNDGPDWLQVKWTSAAPTKKRLLYRVTAVSALTHPREILFMSEDTIVFRNITGLQPGVQWHITAVMRSAQGYIWSDPASIYGTTRDGVPTDLPVTTHGGFDISSISQVKRRITLYWQPVPVQFQRGRITGYKITVQPKTQAARDPIEIPADRCCHLEVSLLMGEQYEVAVVARTSAGYGTGAPAQQAQVTVLPQTALIMLHPVNVTAVATSSNMTQLTWSSQEGSSYTGYWCAHTNVMICEDTVQWLEDISSPWIVPLPASMNPNLFRFGVSADTGTSSSGITWSDCVYNMSRKSIAPIVQGTADSREITLHMKQDAGHACREDQGFVYAYKVSYCPSSSSSPQEEAVTAQVQRVTRRTKWVVSGLQWNTKYNFTVHSVTAAGLSTVPKILNITTPQAGGAAVKKYLVYILIGGLICAVFLVISIYCILRKCGKKYVFYKAKLKVQICRPEQQMPENAQYHTGSPEYAVPKYSKPAIINSKGNHVKIQESPAPILPARPSLFSNLHHVNINKHSRVSMKLDSCHNLSSTKAMVHRTASISSLKVVNRQRQPANEKENGYASTFVLDLSGGGRGDANIITAMNSSSSTSASQKEELNRAKNLKTYDETNLKSDEYDNYASTQIFDITHMDIEATDLLLSGKQCFSQSDVDQDSTIRDISVQNEQNDEEEDNYASTIILDQLCEKTRTLIEKVYPSQDEVIDRNESDAISSQNNLRESENMSTLNLNVLSGKAAPTNHKVFPLADMIDSINKADNIHSQNNLSENTDDDHASTLILDQICGKLKKKSDKVYPLCDDMVDKSETYRINEQDNIMIDDEDANYASTRILLPLQSNEQTIARCGESPVSERLGCNEALSLSRTGTTSDANKPSYLKKAGDSADTSTQIDPSYMDTRKRGTFSERKRPVVELLGVNSLRSNLSQGLGRESYDVDKENRLCGAVIGICLSGEVESFTSGIESCSFGLDKGSILSGLDRGSCLSGSDRESCLSGADIRSCLFGEDLGSCPSGLDMGRCLSGSDRGSSSSGSDGGSCLSGSDMGRRLSGSDKGSCLSGSDRGSCFSGSDMGHRLSGSDKGSCLSRSDRGSYLSGSEGESSISHQDHTSFSSGEEEESRSSTDSYK